MNRKLLQLLTLLCSLFVHGPFYGQADNEIQVYASPTIQYRWTIFELHSNHTFRGTKGMADPKRARWTNETVEITHGIAPNWELGFYTFTAFDPSGAYHYLGNQIRPRFTAPEAWKWKYGASLSAEFGFFRPHTDSAFFWQGEIRPIIDRSWGAFYLALNPNIDFVLTGDNKGAGISPQLKAVYTIRQKFGLGIEYYSGLGSFRGLLPGDQQEHLIGPMFDLYVDPKLELNTGFLFGLTPGSNQRVFKLLLGRRVGK